MQRCRPFNVSTDESQERHGRGSSTRAGPSQPYPGRRDSFDSTSHVSSTRAGPSQPYPGRQDSSDYTSRVSRPYPVSSSDSTYPAAKSKHPASRHQHGDCSFDRLQVSQDKTRGGRGMDNEPDSDRLEKTALQVKISRLEVSCQDLGQQNRALTRRARDLESELARAQSLLSKQSKVIADLENRERHLTTGVHPPVAGLPPRHPSPSRGIFSYISESVRAFASPQRYNDRFDYDRFEEQVRVSSAGGVDANRPVIHSDRRATSAAIGSLGPKRDQAVTGTTGGVVVGGLSTVDLTRSVATGVSPPVDLPVRTRDSDGNQDKGDGEIAILPSVSGHSDEDSVSVCSGRAQPSRFSDFLAEHGLTEELNSEVRRVYRLIKGVDISPKTQADAIDTIIYPARMLDQGNIDRCRGCVDRSTLRTVDFLGCVPEGTLYNKFAEMVRGTQCDMNVHPDEFFKLCMMEFLNLDSTNPAPSARIYGKIRGL